MKGLIVTQRVVEGVMDWAHGGGHDIYRIVLPEANNLCVTFDHGKALYAFTGFEIEKATIVGEVEVPQELVSLLQEYIAATKRVVDAQSAFEALLPPTALPKFKVGDRCRLHKGCLWSQMLKDDGSKAYVVDKAFVDKSHTVWNPSPRTHYIVRREDTPPVSTRQLPDGTVETQHNGYGIEEHDIEPVDT